MASAEGSPSEGSPGARSPARQILDERYARGEIDDDEYHHRRDEPALSTAAPISRRRALSLAGLGATVVAAGRGHRCTLPSRQTGLHSPAVMPWGRLLSA